MSITEITVVAILCVFALAMFLSDNISLWPNSRVSTDFLDRRNTLSDDNSVQFSGSSLSRSAGFARMFNDDSSDFAWSGLSHESDMFDSVSSSSSGYSSSTGSSLFDDDSSDFSGLNDSWINDGPAFNIDGTPMMGMFDIHGNVYGVTDDMFSSSNSDMFSSSSSSSDMFSSSSSSSAFD